MFILVLDDVVIYECTYENLAMLFPASILYFSTKQINIKMGEL